MIAKRLMKNIQKEAIPHEKSTVNQYVTVSLGLATIIPNANISPDELIDLADKALYTSKQNGRNRYTQA